MKTEMASSGVDMRSKKDLFMAVAILFRIIMDISYYVLSMSAFSVEFSLHINFSKMIISYIVLVHICYLTYKPSKMSAFFFRIIIFFTIIPMSSLYCMRDESNAFFLLAYLSFLFSEIVAFSIKTTRESANNEIANRKLDHEVAPDLTKTKVGVTDLDIVVSVICTSLVAITLVLMYYLNGLPSLSTLHLGSVYDLRGNYQTTKYLGYLTSLTTSVIIPFGIAEGSARNKKAQIAFCLAAQLCLFLWTGHKTWLFSILLLLFMMVLYRSKFSMNLFFVAVTLLATFGCLLAILNRDDNGPLRYIFSLLNRRVLLNPASLKFYYYDYFIVREKPLVGLSGTIFAPLLAPKSESTLSYATTISKEYTGLVSNANTGLFGGDLANVGILAFAVVPMLLIVLAVLIEKSNDNCGSEFTLLMFTYLAYSLNDQNIFAYFFDFKGASLIMLILLYRLNIHQRKRMQLL